METNLTLSRSIPYIVSACPVCHKTHNYQLDIQYQADNIAVYFLEKNLALSAPWTGTVTFVCQTSLDQQFTQNVTIVPEGGEKILNITMHVVPALTHSPAAHAPATFSVDQMVEDDLTDAFKTSRSTVQDFCKTMITTATGAIAVFFAVLKFLGEDTATTKVTVGVLAGIASALYLLSALLFTFGYEPQYLTQITSLEVYLKKRADELAAKNKIIYGATILFSLATLLVIISFVFSYLKP